MTGVAQHPHPGEARGATVLGERIQEPLADLRRSHRLRNLETGQEQELAAIGLRDGGAPREPHHGLAVGRDVREAAPVCQEPGVGAALEAAEGTHRGFERRPIVPVEPTDLHRWELAPIRGVCARLGAIRRAGSRRPSDDRRPP